MSRRILIVCKGNICRSPMAAAMLRKNSTGLSIDSAGLAAMEGHPVDPTAEKTLLAHGLSASDHVARQIRNKDLDGADLVLAMEKRQLTALLAISPTLRGRVQVLSYWSGGRDIADPYGRSQAKFDLVYEQIDAAISAWRSRL
ncbi:MAG TPA: low molecular weight protein-tyrosine-phosphatase [Lysobacter sp.]